MGVAGKSKTLVRIVDRIDFFSAGPGMVVMIVGELEDVVEACSQLTGRYWIESLIFLLRVASSCFKVVIQPFLVKRFARVHHKFYIGINISDKLKS